MRLHSEQHDVELHRVREPDELQQRDRMHLERRCPDVSSNRRPQQYDLEQYDREQYDREQYDREQYDLEQYDREQYDREKYVRCELNDAVLGIPQPDSLQQRHRMHMEHHEHAVPKRGKQRKADLHEFEQLWLRVSAS